MKLGEQMKMADRAADREMSSVMRELRSRAVWLKEKMERLVAKIDESGVGASINSLGEVQGMGHDIDRLCAKVGFLQDQKLALKNILREATFYAEWERKEGVEFSVDEHGDLVHKPESARYFAGPSEPTLLLRIGFDAEHDVWEMGFVDLLTLCGYAPFETHMDEALCVEAAAARGFVTEVDMHAIRYQRSHPIVRSNKQPKLRGK